jgi:hypothetical protein
VCNRFDEYKDYSLLSAGTVVLTRRTFHTAAFSLVSAIFAAKTHGEQSDAVVIRVRVDDSVRQSIPLLLQQSLRIELDQSAEANELIRRSPPGRAVPIMLIIAGTIAIPVVVQLMREALRQVYYGGVVLDIRTQPPSVTNDPKIPANMVFVIDVDGKTSRYTSDQLSSELLASVFKAK